MLKIRKFEGLVAAPFAPMDSKGNINAGMIPEYCSFLERNGVTGVFVNGSTGEFASLTAKEKQVIASAWAGCITTGGNLRIINLVGGTSHQECIDNAIYSREAGITAIAVVAPYYFRPVNVDILSEFVARIGEAVPGMAVYFYHIPVFTGVNLPMVGFLEKISAMLPNFAGIKFTHDDLMDFTECLNYRDGAYDMLWGRDETLLSALAAGCRGAVGSTYNYASPLYNALIEAFKRGDLGEARRMQQKAIEMIKLLGKYGGMATGKAFMKYIGLDFGEFRPPVAGFDNSKFRAFTEDVKELGIDGLLSVR